MLVLFVAVYRPTIQSWHKHTQPHLCATLRILCECSQNARITPSGVCLSGPYVCVRQCVAQPCPRSNRQRPAVLSTTMTD